MLSRTTLCAFILLLALTASTDARQASRSIAPADVQLVETLDGSRIYRLTVQLGDKPSDSAADTVEYQVLTAGGVVAGGGMFTVRPDMMTPDGEAVTALTGFGGLDMSLGYRVVAEVTGASRGSAVKSIAEQQITDTCTTFCDRCSDKAAPLCTNGVSTYSCSCASESRSCNFTCGSSKPPV